MLTLQPDLPVYQVPLLLIQQTEFHFICHSLLFYHWKLSVSHFEVCITIKISVLFSVYAWEKKSSPLLHVLLHLTTWSDHY